MKFTLLIATLFIWNISSGQQENDPEYAAIAQIFNGDLYVKKTYPRYQKNIKEVEKNTFRFNNRTVILLDADSSLRELFIGGIFNPDIIFGELPDSAKNTQPSPVFFRDDSLSICCFEELPALNPDFRTKRFCFWVSRPWMVNPTEYYIEFYNKTATKKTSLLKFIRGSVMTFFFKGTIII